MIALDLLKELYNFRNSNGYGHDHIRENELQAQAVRLFNEDQTYCNYLIDFANKMSNVLFGYSEASEREMLDRAEFLVEIENKLQVSEKIDLIIEKIRELHDLINE